MVAALVCLNPLAAEESGRPAQVSVCLSDGAGIPPRALQKARAEVVRIFQQAGIAVRWKDCPPESFPLSPACRRGGESPELALRLELSPPKVRSRLAIPMGHAWMPSPDEPGCLASVYAESVQQATLRPMSASGIVLGHAMGHELGHLLLGTHEHSHVGLMRHHWRREELERALQHNLLFLPHEAAHLRREIGVRAGN